MSKKQVASYIIDKQIIGCGAYAKLVRATVKGSDKVVAIKKVNRHSPEDVRQLKYEVALLREVGKVAHLNIIGYEDVLKSSRHFYLVLEHCNGGSLDEYLTRQEMGRLPEDMARSFLGDIAAGLHAMHSAEALHLDLRPINILLSRGQSVGADHSPVLKLANLGFSRSLVAADNRGGSHVAVAHPRSRGPPQYTAPEVLRHQPYDARADSWSAGIVMHEMLYGRPPLEDLSMEQLLLRMGKVSKNGFEGVSEQAQELLHKLLAEDPESRLCSKDLCIHVRGCGGEQAGSSSGAASSANLWRTRLWPWSGSTTATDSILREAVSSAARAAVAVATSAAERTVSTISAVASLARKQQSIGDHTSILPFASSPLPSPLAASYVFTMMLQSVQLRTDASTAQLTLPFTSAPPLLSVLLAYNRHRGPALDLSGSGRWAAASRGAALPAAADVPTQPDGVKNDEASTTSPAAPLQAGASCAASTCAAAASSCSAAGASSPSTPLATAAPLSSQPTYRVPTLKPGQEMMQLVGE
eukprot:TRINITY_DN27390_c0_g1_i1.p1 TRINITY_DN27390_c0_g1~~TRINITY_DN27390_c0_g1_i1.p1  ORF type:complete len:527 (+),score=94.15 TRINITY_DN27390_c0_g1_i1:140-1720(+)